MRAELSGIKLGDRVVYVVGGVEYNAVALGTASEGWSQAIRLATISLSLTYLNQFGVQVKVIAAPLLGVAADDAYLTDAARAAAERTVGYKTADDDGKALMVAEQLATIRANPRTNGWRPYIEGEEVATLRAQLAQANEAIGRLNHALAETMRAPEPPPPQPATEIPETSGLPSAEDLDAVAAEAAIAAANQAGSLADTTADTAAVIPEAPADAPPPPEAEPAAPIAD